MLLALLALSSNVPPPTPATYKVTYVETFAYSQEVVSHSVYFIGKNWLITRGKFWGAWRQDQHRLYLFQLDKGKTSSVFRLKDRFENGTDAFVWVYCNVALRTEIFNNKVVDFGMRSNPNSGLFTWKDKKAGLYLSGSLLELPEAISTLEVFPDMSSSSKATLKAVSTFKLSPRDANVVDHLWKRALAATNSPKQSKMMYRDYASMMINRYPQE